MAEATIVLPTWDECFTASLAGEATALQLFIFNNEPDGAASEAEFRTGLLAVLQEAADGRDA